MYIDGILYAGYNSLTEVSKDIGENLKAAKPSASSVEVTFESGTVVRFVESKGMMTFVVTISDQYLGKTKGLLGAYNKNPDDDFTLPSGTVLPSNLTSRQIHFDFGQKCKYLS